MERTMYDKIIQVANLDHRSRRINSNNYRVYYSKGIAACINAGGGAKTPLTMTISAKKE